MKRFLVSIVIFLLCLGLTNSALGTGEIKIGFLTALTGSLASFGLPTDYSARLAVDQINAAGGLLGCKVKLVTRDTGASPVVARDAITRLVKVDRVTACVGALSSEVTAATSSVTISHRIVQISPASTSPQLTELDDRGFVFRTCPSDALQGTIQGKLARNLGYETASILFVNNAYGKGIAESFKSTFEKKKGKIIKIIPYDKGKASYREEVESVIRGKPDVLNIIGFPIDGNNILLEAAGLGYRGKYIFADGMKGDSVSQGPASKYIDGSFGTALGTMEVKELKQFEEDYVDKLKCDGVNKRKIKDYMAMPFRTQSYDAVVLIALAIEKAGRGFLKMSPKNQGNAIRRNLISIANPPGQEVLYGESGRAFRLLKEGRDINYQGVSGPLTFDKNGDIREAAIVIWHIKDGKTLSVWTVNVNK